MCKYKTCVHSSAPGSSRYILALRTASSDTAQDTVLLPPLLPQHHVKHHHQSESEGKSYGANI